MCKYLSVYNSQGNNKTSFLMFATVFYFTFYSDLENSLVFFALFLTFWDIQSLILVHLILVFEQSKGRFGIYTKKLNIFRQLIECTKRKGYKK